MRVSVALTSIKFWMLNQPCILGLKITWSQNIITFIWSCIWFPKIILESCVPIFMRDFGLHISFLLMSLSEFSFLFRIIIHKTAPQKELGSILSSLIFQRKTMSIIGDISVINIWKNLPVKPSEPGAFFVKWYLTTSSFSPRYVQLLIVVLSYCLFCLN